MYTPSLGSVGIHESLFPEINSQNYSLKVVTPSDPDAQEPRFQRNADRPLGIPPGLRALQTLKLRNLPPWSQGDIKVE